MVKILYSVNGDGLGHATRSVPIIQALSKKHKVKVLVSSVRSGNFMKNYLENVTMYDGVRFIYDKNSVNVHKTITKNARKVLSRSSNLKIIYDLIKKYHPQIIITDCDFPTIIVAKFFKIPIICVCNIHSLSEMNYAVPREYKKIYYAQKMLIKAISNKIDYHVLTTFFYLPVKKKNVFLYPPILREEILKMVPKRKKHYLIYQTSSTDENLVSVLKSVNEKFIVYGYDNSEIDGNITFRKTNNEQFFKDFKDCKACIANGGYSFISEAVSLHKPILSIPINGQFEQVLNALQIKRLGYGDICNSINQKTLLNFIKNNDRYYNNIKKHKIEDNSKIIAKIEGLIIQSIEAKK
jgi:uncharacterized protein (TIGR00661 family)